MKKFSIDDVKRALVIAKKVGKGLMILVEAGDGLIKLFA